MRRGSTPLLTSDAGPGTPGKFHIRKANAMQSIFDLKQSQREALTAAEAILATADQRGTGMTKAESENYDAKMAEYDSFSRNISASEKRNTIRQFFRDGKPGPALLGSGEDSIGFMGPFSVPPPSAETRTTQYKASLLSYLRTGGKAHSEELTVGADGVGEVCHPRL